MGSDRDDCGFSWEELNEGVFIFMTIFKAVLSSIILQMRCKSRNPEKRVE